MTKDILKIWKRDGFRLTLYYQGTDKLAYRFSDHGKIIFEGNDFRPSPMHAIDSLNAVYGLLAFLCLVPGDTDSEYFKYYSENQLNWCKSNRAETLKLYVHDFEVSK